MTTVANAQAEPAQQCPYHPEPYLRFQTKWKSLLAIAGAIGDTVHYCAGDGGRCSWVASEQTGTLVLPGLDRLEPVDVKRIYQRAIAEKLQRDRERDDSESAYGTPPWQQ